MVGRFLGSWVLRKVSPRAVLAFNALVNTILVVASMMTSGPVAMWSIILVGFFNSIMFPTIFTLGIEGLGPLTGEGSGLLNTAIVGGAVIPPLQGLIADRAGIHHALILPVICYLYIVLFALKGKPVTRAVPATTTT
jgi:FHS family L-fucose permease-like MFS transporter